MGDLTTSASPDRVSAAEWVARCVLASFIFGIVFFILFWPMWQSGALKVQLGLACGDMIAQMGQPRTVSAGFAHAVARPECWPVEAKTDSTR
jgi:hypothetical protein